MWERARVQGEGLKFYKTPLPINGTRNFLNFYFLRQQCAFAGMTIIEI